MSHPQSENESLSTAGCRIDLANVLDDLQTSVDENNAGALRVFYAQNKGLLIISLGQLLFSMMYMGVKVITVADTPVPTFEVS
jgi:hypothetical protein